jgi:hypothetical protein
MPQKKSPVTPPGIDPGTFQLVVQFLKLSIVKKNKFRIVGLQALYT